MAGKGGGGKPQAVSDLVSDLLDPVLRKRTGISMSLIQSWEEIVGERLATRSRPEKIAWPRRAHEDDPFEPATLTIACEGSAALHIQHETSEIINRINGFLGFSAIGRIKIVQKPVRLLEDKRRPVLRALSAPERALLSGKVGGIEDEGLRSALERLGASVIASRK